MAVLPPPTGNAGASPMGLDDGGAGDGWDGDGDMIALEDAAEVRAWSQWLHGFLDAGHPHAAVAPAT